MNKEIIKLEHCLLAMKKCLKIPHVENCICFSDAFKVLSLEVNRLQNIELSVEEIEKITEIKGEVENIKKNISLQDKECLGCNPCMAAVVFKAYPDALNNLYTDNEL